MIFSRDYIGISPPHVKHLIDAKLITTSDKKVTRSASARPSSMSFRSKTASMKRCA